ncbi:hypothetical protein WMW72_17285 [Paenibacillus filicis]|uniref:Uncharacterized protein n=1 Tax=Paenibacillus filicis TaxID=669464 RepID=A0ABU9DLC8_9BACL
MRLIEFLLNNWVFVAIAFFVLSSLLKKGGGRTGNAQRPNSPGGRPNSMPPFGGGGMGWPSKGEPPAARRASAEAEPAPGRPVRSSGQEYQSPSGSRETSVYDRMDEPAGPSAAAVPITPRYAREGVQASSRPASDAPAGSASPSSPLGSLRPEDVARGVIWAEILGPPRAKRPYRRK